MLLQIASSWDICRKDFSPTPSYKSEPSQAVFTSFAAKRGPQHRLQKLRESLIGGVNFKVLWLFFLYGKTFNRNASLPD